MKFRPVLDALEDRKLLSFGGGNVDTSIPRYPSTSPQLNFTSNSFHNINATIPGVASSILKTESSTDAQLASYVANIPNGETALLPILEADVSKFEKGGAAALTATQANFIVTTLYNDLDLTFNSAGMAAFSTELQQGATMAQVTGGLVTSQEYIQQSIAGASTANQAQTQFVDSLYYDVLGRSPEPGGAEYWVNQINTGALTVQQVATDFVNSPEAATSPMSILANPTIVSLYETFLDGRYPDAGGLANFTTAFQNGATIEQAVDVFVTSPEFIQQSIAGASTANQAQTQFVDSLYYDVLGREADPGGEAFWVNEINTGALTVQQVAVDIVGSTEAATSPTSILVTTPVITTTGSAYYFGSAAPNGTIYGNFSGTSQSAQLSNLIQNDTIAYLGNGIGKSFNILKSGASWASDNLLTYNGYVS